MKYLKLIFRKFNNKSKDFKAEEYGEPDLNKNKYKKKKVILIMIMNP